MPLLAAPVLASVIGAAGSIGGGLLARKAGVGSPSQQEKDVLGQNQANLKQASGYASELFPQGKNLLDLSRSTFQPPIDYWKSILGGSRTNATSMLAPDIQRIQEGYQTAGKTISDLYPRSGISPEGRVASIYAPQRDISTLLQSARPKAAEALGTLAGQTGALGSYETGDAMRTLVGSAGAGTGTLDQMLRQRAYESERQASLGKSIGGLLFDIMKKINIGGSGKDIFNQTGTSGSVFP